MIRNVVALATADSFTTTNFTNDTKCGGSGDGGFFYNNELIMTTTNFTNETKCGGSGDGGIFYDNELVMTTTNVTNDTKCGGC